MRKLRKKRRVHALIALGAAAALVATGCGGDGKKTYKPDNRGLTQVLNPSDQRGGTLKVVNSDKADSLDPGDTYYGYSWNWDRLMFRALTTFKPVPGEGSNEVVPDLAQELGKSDDGGKTWLFKIRPNIKFEDGTPVTSKDVKYAVERTFDQSVLSNGPAYFKTLLDPAYPGPYKDPAPDKLGLKAVETPDDLTIIFKLNQPFADFNHLATLPQTAPVPQAKDTGKEYIKHPMATGPYMLEGQYEPGKQQNLVRNPHWKQEDDPIRRALPDRIELLEKQESNDIDNRLIAGTADLDQEGLGLQAQAQSRVLQDKKLAANTDNPNAGSLAYIAISTKVAPFDNVHCRRAVQYAVDKTAMQLAWGGATGGEIATNTMPPIFPGAKKIDPYPQAKGNHSNVEKAKAELKECGQEKGFSTKLTARNNRPKEVAAATALQQALKKIGVDVEIQQFPSGDYFSQFAGVPDWVHQNKVGLMMMRWGPDFPTYYGFYQQIVDSRAIKPSGGTNLPEINDPAIDAMIDKASATLDRGQQLQTWTDLDAKVMDNASMVPFIWEKQLLFRGPQLTNAFTTPAYTGQYDYSQLGVKR